MFYQKLGNTDIKISKIGLGCMGMSQSYGETDDAQSLKTLDSALEHGINFFDTANVYGLGHNEQLLGKFIQTKHRDEIVIATKCGIVGSVAQINVEKNAAARLNGSYQHIIQACEASLKHLKIDYIDLYYLHRVDPQTEIEESMRAMLDLQKQGKIRSVGLSEVNVSQIERAQSVVPISAVQSEYSLWHKSADEKIIPFCDKFNITFVPYSPIGRGFLSGKITDLKNLSDQDFRNTLPRMQGENFQKNNETVLQLQTLAEERKCTLAQLSLAWIYAKHKNIIPIPGTKRIEYLLENIESLKINLSQDDIENIEKIIQDHGFYGERYSAEVLKNLNTEK